MTLRIDRSRIRREYAEQLDKNLKNAAERRARNQSLKVCINENSQGTHGPATHGVLCRKCRAVHRGVSVHQVEDPIGEEEQYV